MTSMIEKVAAALLKELISSGEYVKDLGDGLIKFDGCVDLGDIASVAIEAMRTPTTEMVDVGTEARWQSAIRDSNSVREIWQHMIDAALKEQENVG